MVGDIGDRYQVLGSTNLADWVDAGGTTNVFGTVQFLDAAATNTPARLYRGRLLP